MVASFGAYRTEEIKYKLNRILLTVCGLHSASLIFASFDMLAMLK